MSQYENEFSNFPDKLITRHNFKDVDDKIAPVINEIKSLQLQGLYNKAAILIENYKNILPQYIIGSAWFRTIEEEIYNAQKYTKANQQVIYFEDEEPDFCLEGDVWLGV